MTLSDYLDAASNLHAREELLNYRLLFDTKLAAASFGYHLLTYYSDVNHDGFDIIFDDRQTVRKVQLKSTSLSATTSSWHIHRSILRPTRQNWERLGFFHRGMAYLTDCGVEGGVILMEFDGDNTELPVSYFYTDIFVISAIALGHLNRGGPTNQAAVDLRAELVKGSLTDKIGVAKGLFVRLATPAHLLAILSMQSPSRVNWQSRIMLSAQERWGQTPDMLADVLAEQIAEILPTLKQACGHDEP